MVSDLLAKGIDPNIHNEDGKSLMHYAAKYGHLDIVNILLEHPTCNKEQCSTLLEKFICNLEGWNNLQYLPIMQKLITHGASVNRPIKGPLVSSPSQLEGCCDGNAALHMAVYRHIFITQLLIDGDANVNVKTTNNFSPLHIASGLPHHIGIVEMLIGKGADVNAKNDFGKTPLHYAAEDGHASIIKILLKNDAKINEGDNSGNTPLHTLMAKLSSGPSVVFSIEAIEALLINPYLIINAENHDKKTPLDLVINTEIRELLIKHGAKTGNQLLLESMKGDCTIQ